MVLLKTKNYIKSSLCLPKEIKLLLLKQESILLKDIFDSKLHTKKLQDFSEDHIYSFRVTRAYRGIFRLSGDQIILFAIGNRKAIYESF